MRSATTILTCLAALITAPAAAAAFHAPKTAWGAPDLSGQWTNTAVTRLERPPGVTGLEIEGASADALAGRLVQMRRNAANDLLGQGESEWDEPATLGRIGGRYRTSWITSPADGRLPYTPAGRALASARMAGAVTGLDGPESRTTSDRCLGTSWGAIGPPILNSPYSGNYLIAQARDEVVIVSEINHDVRHIRLNAPRDPAAPRVWMGQSIGRFEGGTLVVETQGFRADEGFHAPVLYLSKDAKVTERFTPMASGELLYRFEVDDPATFTEVWRGEMPMRRSAERIYEYACHEGNYSMANILAGARREEALAAAKAKPAP